MECDSDPVKRGETETEAISVPMHEQLFYLAGFHYGYDFLEVNYFFQTFIDYGAKTMQYSLWLYIYFESNIIF